MRKELTLIILLLLFGKFAISQFWQDSLRVGNKLYKERDYTNAYQTLLNAQKSAPEGVDLSQDIGNAAYRNDDFKMAEKAFQSAAQKSGNDVQEAKQWHNVGNSQMKTKNYQAAIESYKTSLRKDPSSNETRYNLAEAQRRLKLAQEQQGKSQENDEGRKGDENQPKTPSESDSRPSDNEESSPSDQSNETREGEDKIEGKLSSRKADRMLEDILKKEIQTKRRVRDIEDNHDENQVKSGKKW